jgi:hypothetical protein
VFLRQYIDISVKPLSSWNLKEQITSLCGISNNFVVNNESTREAKLLGDKV